LAEPATLAWHHGPEAISLAVTDDEDGRFAASRQPATAASSAAGLKGFCRLVTAPSFSKLLIVELWFSWFFGIYNGAMIPHLAEIMPPEIRTSGFSLAFSLATAIFGGFTPAVCTYLIHETGNRAMPALWLSFAAVCGLVASVAGGWKRAVLPELESSASPQ